MHAACFKNICLHLFTLLLIFNLSQALTFCDELMAQNEQDKGKTEKLLELCRQHNIDVSNEQ